MTESPTLSQAQRIMFRDPVLSVLAAIERSDATSRPPAYQTSTKAIAQPGISA